MGQRAVWGRRLAESGPKPTDVEDDPWAYVLSG